MWIVFIVELQQPGISCPTSVMKCCSSGTTSKECKALSGSYIVLLLPPLPLAEGLYIYIYIYSDQYYIYIYIILI